MNCTGPECNRIAYHAEPPLCKAHYHQKCRGQGLKPLKFRPSIKPPVICTGPGCVREASYRKLELCSAHKQQWDSRGALKPLRSAIAKTKIDGTARDDENRKQCTSCREWLDLSEYTKHSTTVDGLSRVCCQCQRDHMLRKKYKLSLADYNTRLVKQGGHCATCPAVDRLHVDHDHSCCPGEKSCGQCVRDILCHRCNSTLGFVDDSLELLSNLVTYITLHRSETLGSET